MWFNAKVLEKTKTDYNVLLFNKVISIIVESKKERKKNMNQINIEKQEELVNAFMITETRNQTLEMCEAALGRNGLFIENVSKRLLSKELCVKAIRQNPEAFLLLSKEYICKETLIAVYEEAKAKKKVTFAYEIEKKINRMRGISLEGFLDIDLAKAMVSLTPYYLNERMFYRFRDKVEVIELALEKDGDKLSFIPQNEVTKEHVIKAIKGEVSFEKIPSDFLEDDDILDAMSAKGARYLKKLPNEKKTYQRCLLGVKEDFPIKDVPAEHHTQEMAIAFVTEGKGDLRDVPDKLINKELILKGAEVCSAQFMFFDSPLIDEELAFQLTQKGVSISYNCIRRNQSQRIVDAALSESIGAIQYADPCFLTDEIVDEAIKKCGRLIKHIPKEFVNEERAYLAVCNDAGFLDVIQEYQSQRIIDELLRQKYFYSRKRASFEVNLRLELIDKVKEEFKTKDFYRELAKLEPRILNYMPEKMIDEELCYIAACAGGDLSLRGMMTHQSQRIVDTVFKTARNVNLYFVNDEFKTDDIIKKGLKKNCDNIKYVPHSKLSEELAYHFVCEGGMLHQFPNIGDYQSERVVKKALDMNPYNMPEIKPEFLTKELVEDAFNRKIGVILDAPKEFVTEEMWITYIQKEDERLLEKIGMGAISEKMLTKEVISTIVERDWKLVGCIPNEFLTIEKKMIAFEMDQKTLTFFDI